EISLRPGTGAHYLSRQEEAAAGRKAQDMTDSPLDIQAALLWKEMLAWLSSHSLQILIGTAVAAFIVVALMGVKWLGVRICRTDPTHTHWRTIVGRVLTRTKLWFMVALAARLVVGY